MALVDVALKKPNVGVDVAEMFPEASVAKTEFTEIPVSLMDEVATKDDAVTVPPSKKPEPATESPYPGVEEAMPTLPVLEMINLVFVDEPITKLGTFVPSAFGLTDRSAHGVLVPIPMLPEFCWITN